MMTGRFAPSPSGRMHLGNLYTALISWLSIRRQGGKWILRIENLDPQRSKPQFARQIEEDLLWLGLDWDEGGLDNVGANGPYVQSQRYDLYHEALSRLAAQGLLYPCRCHRADILATQAPHRSDGRVVYAGTCRPSTKPPFDTYLDYTRCSTRIYVPDEVITFEDLVYGVQSINLTEECGDFILRRADGAWAYQLAVVVDDALMGVTEVVRGSDLLQSSAQQIYLYRLLGYEPPKFIHLPLLCNETGQRLSKRDHSLSMESLRETTTRSELLRRLALIAGFSIPYDFLPSCPSELLPYFSLPRLGRNLLEHESVLDIS